MVVEAFGVTVEITADAPLLSAIDAILPPGAKPSSERPDGGRFALIPRGKDGLLDVQLDGESIVGGPLDAAVALGALDAQIRMHVALHAPDHVFVHAGVVGIEEQAIVVPGTSFAGKTALVAALVRAGAGYWSDEYAVLDAEGRVHPYAKPLSVRTDSKHPDARPTAEDHPVESLGGHAGRRAIPVGLIALTHYVPTRTWAPRRCSAGEGAVKMLEHTICARARPAQALAAVRAAALGAVVMEGSRGEADGTAAALIAELAGSRR
jgi:hypothetical protein